MAFQLFLDLNGLKYYGDIPEVPDNSDGRVEEYPLSLTDIDYMKEDLDCIDSLCHALLDIGDVDFFDARKCAILKCWIDKRLQKPIAPRYKDVLKVLKTYCERAIELNTGVVIEL